MDKQSINWKSGTKLHLIAGRTKKLPDNYTTIGAQIANCGNTMDS